VHPIGRITGYRSLLSAGKRRKERNEVSNFIVEQKGSASKVAEKVLDMHWNTAWLLLGAIVGTVFDLDLGRRLMPGEIDGQLRVSR
jgi:hypothetical protein